jgi:hypothetical protein
VADVVVGCPAIRGNARPGLDAPRTYRAQWSQRPNEDSARGARPVSFPSASTAGRSADRTTARTKRTNPTTTPHREAARVLEPRGAPAAAVTEHVLRAGHRDAVPLVRQLAATAGRGHAPAGSRTSPPSPAPRSGLRPLAMPWARRGRRKKRHCLPPSRATTSAPAGPCESPLTGMNGSG